MRYTTFIGSFVTRPTLDNERSKIAPQADNLLRKTLLTRMN